MRYFARSIMGTPNIDKSALGDNASEALPVGGAIAKGEEGKYTVKLADGRVMTVSYVVDGDGGFRPEISFSD
ncbi:chitin-binding domain-containing protein [Pseudomonas sp. ZS1P83]